MGNNAKNFIESYSSTKRLAAVHILTSVYCRVGCNGTGDIAAPLARRDHRKLKFGPRYSIKLDDEKSYGNLRKPARVHRAHVMH